MLCFPPPHPKHLYQSSKTNASEEPSCSSMLLCTKVLKYSIVLQSIVVSRFAGLAPQLGSRRGLYYYHKWRRQGHSSTKVRRMMEQQ